MVAAKFLTLAGLLVTSEGGQRSPTLRAASSCRGLVASDSLEGRLTHRTSKVDSTPPSLHRASAAACRRSGADKPSGISKCEG